MGSITSYTMTKTHYGFQYDIERIPRKSLSSRIWSVWYGVGESYKWSHFNANIWYEHTRDYFDILFCLFENLQLCSTSKLFLIIKLIFHCIHPYLQDQKMSIYSLYIRCIYKRIEKGSDESSTAHEEPIEDKTKTTLTWHQCSSRDLSKCHLWS